MYMQLPDRFDEDGMLRQRGYVVDIDSCTASHNALALPNRSRLQPIHAGVTSSGDITKSLPLVALRSALWAAGFSFSRAADTLVQSPYDGTLSGLFFGEEQVMAARQVLGAYIGPMVIDIHVYIVMQYLMVLMMYDAGISPTVATSGALLRPWYTISGTERTGPLCSKL
jgi:hypothetical protein